MKPMIGGLGPNRDAIMGISTFNARLPHLQGKKTEDGKESKRAKPMTIKVSFTIRPSLPACATRVMTLPSTARTSDVLGAAWAELDWLRERHGSMWGPLPSNDVNDYALHFVREEVREGNPLRVAEVCPSSAVFSRMIQTRQQPEQSTAAAGGSGVEDVDPENKVPGGLTSSRSALGLKSKSFSLQHHQQLASGGGGDTPSPHHKKKQGDTHILSRVDPAATGGGGGGGGGVSSRSTGSMKSLVNTPTVHSDNAPRDGTGGGMVAPRVMLVDGPENHSPPLVSQQASWQQQQLQQYLNQPMQFVSIAPSGINEANFIPHVCLVANSTFMQLEKLLLVEIATRRAITAAESENALAIQAHEVEAKELQELLVTHAEKQRTERSDYCEKEAVRRRVVERRYDLDTESMLIEFRRIYAALEFGMVAQYNHIVSLRAEYQLEMEQLKDERRKKTTNQGGENQLGNRAGLA